MTFVVVGISFSKFQSMNLIISVSQSSAWDAFCLVPHRSSSIRKCLYVPRNFVGQQHEVGSNGVERVGFVANSLVTREELICRPVLFDFEFILKQV